MIAGFIRGQSLRLSVPVIAADTINYLTAKFMFQTSDWDGAEKWVHFQCGDAVYESVIDNNVWAPDVYPAGWTEVTA